MSGGRLLRLWGLSRTKRASVLYVGLQLPVVEYRPDAPSCPHHASPSRRSPHLTGDLRRPMENDSPSGSTAPLPPPRDPAKPASGPAPASAPTSAPATPPSQPGPMIPGERASSA